MATDFPNDIRVQVWWGGGFTMSEYKSIGSINDNCVLSISEIASALASDNVSTAGQCTITLHERDAEFQLLLPGQMNRSPANVVVNGVTVFVGETRSCVWGEGQRELSFSIVARVKHGQVGYVLSDDAGAPVNEQARGKPWPICFGTPRKARGLRIQQVREGKTMYPISVCDNLGAIESMWKYFTRNDWFKSNSPTPPTTAASALQAQDVYFAKMHVRETKDTNTVPPTMSATDEITITEHDTMLNSAGEVPEGTVSLDVGGVIHEGTLAINPDQTLKFTITTPNKVKWAPTIVGRVSGDPDEKNPTVVFLDNTTENLRRRYEGNWFTVLFTDPAGRVGPSGNPEITVNDSQRIFSARIIGQKGRKLYLDIPGNALATGNASCLFVSGTANIYGAHPSGFTNAIEADWEELKKSVLQQSIAVSTAAGAALNMTPAAQQAAAAPLLKTLKANAHAMFASWQAGTYVRVWGDQETWVVNGVPSSAVKKVWTSKQVPIPAYLYTTTLSSSVTVDGTPRNVTKIVFDYPLSSYFGELEATDDLCFATVASSISSNPVTQMDYIRSNYTTMAAGTGWANATTKLANYPAHWAMYDIRDALELIKDIAFQCVCGIRTELNSMDCIFLGEIGTAVASIDEANSMWQSAFAGYIDDGRLVTQVTSAWVEDGVAKEKRYTKASTTAGKYGLNRFLPAGINVPYRKNTAMEELRSYQFFIFNNPLAVKNVSDYWLTRLSHIWRSVNFKASPDVAVAKVFDWMNMDYEFGNISDIGMVIEHSFDPTTGENGYKVMLATSTEGDGATLVLAPLALPPKNPSDLDLVYNAMMQYGHEYVGQGSRRGVDKSLGALPESRPALMGIIQSTSSVDGGSGVGTVTVSLYEMGWFKPLTRTVSATGNSGGTFAVGERVVVTMKKAGMYEISHYQEAQ